MAVALFALGMTAGMLVLLIGFTIVPEHTERLARLRPWLARLDAELGLTVVVAHDLAAGKAAGLPGW